MKALRFVLIVSAIVLNLTFAVTVSAAAEKDAPIKVDVNGQFVAFQPETGYPYVDENRRTLVPLRAAMEAYGCDVTWDAASSTAVLEKDGIRVEVPMGQHYIKREEFEIFTDTKASLSNGRVYLPIRAVAEAFGAEVQWNQATKTVMVTSPESQSNQISVHFMDVGHGDSIFIDDGTYEVLIDGGLTTSGALISEYIRPYVDGSIDLLIATHAHQDHVGGLPRIFEDYQIDRVIGSGSSVNTPQWQAYKQALDREPNCIVSEDADETIQLPNGVTLDIIEALDGQTLENNNSVVALLRYQAVSVLFTGDSQTDEEAVIAKKVGKVDVFKGAHHGSYNANSSLLLDTIKPQYVVISAGKGVNYTHPHASALKRMFQEGAIVYGTFKSGTIIMKADGKAYSFETPVKPLIPLDITDAGTYQNNIR
ncbi:stalk domain-containing protein [Aminipila luticellarii]|uniref:MBL fold metallo-hydrolase n=1 Tax=Aminipila luticellarii TaxID=2507160 RepID=A0A410PTC7_9FIRM|nr:stalk domain-containing protein [Aminipila luticellarii]QAT42164.1 MBL fold metallo-hydrolase [Aminipila luticellarii]